MSVRNIPDDARPTRLSDTQEDRLIELYGPENGGWYSTTIPDWVGLCESLRDSDARGYLVLRGLVVEKFANPVRKLTLLELCELFPGPNGRPSSLSRIRDILRNLTAVGLVTTPEGDPITTSSRASTAGKTLRIRINDKAPEGYTGWRNAGAKLASIRASAELKAEQPPAEASQAATEAGQNSDPHPGAGQNSDPVGRNSDPVGRNSDPDSRDDQRKRDLPRTLSGNTSLSSPPSAAGSLENQERETALPDAPPAAVPLPREEPVAGQADCPVVADVDVALVVDAYAQALGRPLVNGTRARLEEQAAELLAAGYGAEWLADRAREMAPKGWTDLVKHVERSTVPVTPLPGGGGGRPDWCGSCEQFTRMVADDDGFLQPCPECGPRLSAGAAKAGAR